MNQRFEFDEWAKDLARGVSRREALRRLGGGLAGALLAALGVSEAWGAPNPNPCSVYCSSLPSFQRKNCNNACKQCGGHTENVCASRNSDKVVCCDAGACCTNGACTATDVLTSNTNCGACGHACTQGNVCLNGTCGCPLTQAVCDGGVCCGPGQGCVSGACCGGTGSTCSGNSACCSGNCSGGTCCLPDGTACTSSADCCSGNCFSLVGAGVCLPV